MDKVVCSLCGYKGEMNDYNGRKGAKCPGCDALERHRALFSLLRQSYSPRRCLHVAPINKEECRKILESMGFDYFPIDIEGIRGAKMDVQKMSFKDNFFNLVICLHVLEHVDDDMEALEEIERVLDPRDDAVIIFQVPFGGKMGDQGHKRVYTIDDFKRKLSLYFEWEIIDEEGEKFFVCRKKHGLN